MRAVVTGAAGFVGRALTAELLRRGDEVVATVRTPSKLPATRTVVTGDIGTETDWSGVFAGADVVFHLAAHVHRLDPNAARDLERFRAVNAAGTESVARAAVAAGVRRIVYLSTAAIHGTDSRSGSFTENDAPAPATAYGTSKWEGEERLRAVCAGTSTEFTILRPPLVYGPTVAAKFLQLLGIVRRGIPLPFGAVKNARSMMFVGNLVDALLVAATSPQTANDAFLVADAEAWSTPDLIRELGAIMGRPARLVPVPQFLLPRISRLLPLLTSVVVDPTKFRERTGWKQPHTAREGLRATVEWYRARPR